MKNNNSMNIMDFMKFPVIISAVIIVAGLVIAFISGEVAWILIGVSVTALGVFQLVSSLASIREDLRKSKIIKNPFGDKDKFKDSYDLKNTDYIQNKNKDEGFKVINKKNSSEKTAQPDTEKVFEDADEYVRIKGKVKKSDSEKEKGINEQTFTKDNSTEKDDINIKDTQDNNFKKDSKAENIAEKPNESDNKLQSVKKVNNTDELKNTETESKEIKDKQTIMESNEQKIEYASIESIQELVKNENFKNSNPKSELDYLLSKLLLILSSITDTKTAVFAIVNQAEKQFSIESFVTTIPKKISRQTLFDFGDDLISKVIINQKPEMIKSLNQEGETDLLKYYSTKTGTKSFIGIPIFLEKTVAGVLCVDSNSNNAYDENIIQLLSNFKHLCTAFISNYNEKYTLYHDRNTLLAIDKFNELIIKNEDNQYTIINAIINSASSIFFFNRIGICGYNENGNYWNIIASNTDDYKTGSKVDTENGIIAKTINNYEPVYTKIADDTGIRLYKDEPKMSKGFFVSIPIRTQKNNYGALFAEYDNNKYLNESDIKSMLELAEYAALAIEKINVSEILASASIIDQNNGFHNKNALLHRIQEEIIRASDFKYKLSLVLIKLDKYDAYEQYPDKLDRIIDYVITTIENNLKAYDILGQTGNDVYGVLLIEKDASGAKFWAEKVRTQIANSMIEINSHRLSVTVSIGIAELNESMKLNDFINAAKEGLKISLNKTNSVTVF